jgi:hypothetical protein
MVASKQSKEQPAILEKHWTVKELSILWHVSVFTLRAWFKDEPGVLNFYGASKKYTSLRIPESVARRVYLAKMKQPA